MNTAQIHSSREDWLTAAIDEVRPMFAAEGLSLAPKIRVTCGFPAHHARSGRVGECHASAASADQHYEILISPVLADPARVFDVLIHELCHTLPGCMNHGVTFAHAAHAMSLTPAPDWKSTAQAFDFAAKYGDIIESLGTYPHAALMVAGKTQSTRMLKAACPHCGYTVRLTKKWADLGLPECPVDGQHLTLA
jgi:hypothetical protein